MLSQYTIDLLYSYSEKRPALGAAALLRMSVLDFSKRFSSPAEESLPTTILWYLQYSMFYSTY